MRDAVGRHFLFLQGPHGPFSRHLAAALVARRASVRKVAFNAADEAEWRGAGPVNRFRGPMSIYRDWIAERFSEQGITDIVLYGDSRPAHADAIAIARATGTTTCHCFEEGYIRPAWITYERGSTNGATPLHEIPLAAMDQALRSMPAPVRAPETDRQEDGWGAHHAHLWHSGVYHARLLIPSRRYGRYRSLREIGLGREVANYAGRAAGLPLRRITQARTTRRLLESCRPYHLALLQLSFDSSLRAHSSFRGAAEFAAQCVVAFAAGAPVGEMLVFKSHPFDDGREHLGKSIAAVASDSGIPGRVLFLDGAPSLAALIDGAKSVVTVNSTAAHHALWRGLPVAALGRAVYSRPELVSSQPLVEFFADPQPPLRDTYLMFRRFLLETSQFRGSFYDRSGVEGLCATLPDAMLAPNDPYQSLLCRPAPHVQARVAAAKASSGRTSCPVAV